jgi:phosphoglycerate dehydrogenase-like enzyme
MAAEIAILDDDHINRLIRYAIAGPGEVTQAWAEHFFMPEHVDFSRVGALGAGLKPADGVSLVPMSVDARKGTGAQVLIFRRGVIDAALMDANPKLKLIQRIGERAEMIDLPAAKARGIAVSCLPRPSLQFTAEHAILLMLALAKKLIVSDDAVRNDRWDRARVFPDNGVAYNWAGISGIGGLYGATVGIVGLGEVGAMAAKMANGFGARVVYCNRTRLSAEREAQYGVSYLPLPQLLAQSDFVSMHASNLPENKGMIDAAFFAQMKRTAFFVNTSRGRMVDEAGLRDALAAGTIAGAGLDVHATEPRPMPNLFAGLANVIMTPHLAGGARDHIIAEIAPVFGNCRAAVTGGGEIAFRVV